MPSADSDDASLPPLVPPCIVDISNCKWENVNEDEDGNVKGFFGLNIGDFSSKQLRTICSRLEIRGCKNITKGLMIEMIRNVHKNMRLYDDACMSPLETDSTRKEVQCSFRLMNVLFSDKFAEEFAMIGNVASRAELDKAPSMDQVFWEGVQKEFVDPTVKEIGVLSFSDNDVFEDKCYIDPSKIVDHSWKKLRTIWKGVNADYKAALTRFTLSGTNTREFWDFCMGKLESYYLRKWLETKPELTGMVDTKLPDETFMSSGDKEGMSSKAAELTKSSFNSEKKKRRTEGKDDGLVTIIKEFTNAKQN